jgi:hypothetical protein
MGRPYSDDLRERVVRAVIKGGMSRHHDLNSGFVRSDMRAGKLRDG